MNIHSPNTEKYISSTDAVSKFPEKCTAIAARLNDYQELEVFIHRKTDENRKTWTRTAYSNVFLTYAKGKASLETEYRNFRHDQTESSCPDIFLLHISTIQKKKKILLVYYLYFCISLHRIIIRYLRSNRHISPLISNTLSLAFNLNDSS